MAKDKLTEYSATNASNDVIGDISVSEGMLPSAVNNALREQMTHLKNFADGTDGINVLSLDDDDASASIKIQAPSAVTTTTTLTLPDGDGDAGAMLQTNGSGQLAWSTAYRNSNLILNGSMQVAQRGTSFSSITSAVYPVDRFFVGDVNAPVGEATVSQSTTAPDDFKYSLKVDVTTADAALVAADQYKIEHRIEGQNISHLNLGTSAAKTVTLSFWIRSNKTGNTQVALLNSANNRSYVATFTIGVANTWEKKELTIDGDTSGTWLTTNGIGLRLRWGSYGSTYQTSSVDQWVGSQVMSRDDSPINFFDSTDNELYLTGVQLEVGEQATPFEHRSYGDELAACQRYYINSGTTPFGTSSASNILFGRGESYLGWDYPVEMRTAPTVATANDTSTGAGRYAVSGVNNYTDGVVATNTSRHFRMRTPSTHASYDTRTGYEANAEL